VPVDWEEHGLEGWREDYFRFVHGTSTDAPFAVGEYPKASGHGEFGLGFYTFLACGRFTRWGEQAARQWARRQVADAADFGLRPRLVYLLVARDCFQRMSQLRVNEDTIDPIYRELHPSGSSQFDLVWGPISRGGPSGQRIRRFELPFQYKFEATALHWVEVESIQDE
jgi:hypothetical protein